MAGNEYCFPLMQPVPWQDRTAAQPWNVIDYGQYQTLPYRFTPYPDRLHDSDIERIAQRVAEILRGARPAVPSEST
jgi:hypothetical protein